METAAMTPTIGEDPAARRARLEARLRELAHEVRHYPTPIARCDEQLTKLLEERDAARRELAGLDRLFAGEGC